MPRLNAAVREAPPLASGRCCLGRPASDPVEHDPSAAFQPVRQLAEGRIDVPFRAAAEATQEAVVNALCAAPSTLGRGGKRFPSLTDWLRDNP